MKTVSLVLFACMVVISARDASAWPWTRQATINDATAKRLVDRAVQQQSPGAETHTTLTGTLYAPKDHHRILRSKVMEADHRKPSAKTFTTSVKMSNGNTAVIEGRVGIAKAGNHDVVFEDLSPLRK